MSFALLLACLRVGSYIRCHASFASSAITFSSRVLQRTYPFAIQSINLACRWPFLPCVDISVSCSVVIVRGTSPRGWRRRVLSNALIRSDPQWEFWRKKGIRAKLPFGMLITSFLIARIISLRYSLSDDRSSRRCPRETDDVNTPLENVPCQTSIIAYPPRSLWIITDHHRAEGIGTRNGIALCFLLRHVYPWNLWLPV